MITQKVRKVGNSLTITIPREEAERLGLVEGDMVAASLNKIRMEVELSPRVRAATDHFLREYGDLLDYLADK
ncbi:MAG TPA: AbrB/MazE/SpoVT family DNA-binding domain-containing protein [Chloroflexota bacterium]|jgi:putative addiction module antidote